MSIKPDLSLKKGTNDLKMGQVAEKQDSEREVMRIFFENPTREFTIRELAKESKIPRTTAHKYISKLKKIQLIKETNSAGDTLLFKTKKINYFTEELVSSGLIEFLVKELNPSCIILFGSIRKGDSVKESDIDLFVESSIKKDLNLKNFEKKLGHPLQIFIESDINNLQKNLQNNVINGIKIYGSFKIK